MLINLIASGFAMILLVSSIALIVLISSENNLVHELKSQAHIIVERIMDIVKSTGLPYHLLDIELTESILMDRSKETLNKLEKLSNLGITISVDDFGTGYSSISYLKRYPIDTLKIDQSFISDLTGDANDAAINLAIIAMGKSLGMTIIAEGKETEAQLAFLKMHECNKVQGYLLGHQMSAEKAEQFIINESNLSVEPSHPLDVVKP